MARLERCPWRLITRCLTCHGYGPDLEHIQIVIRLEDEAVTAFHALLNNFVNITQVGDHADFNALLIPG